MRFVENHKALEISKYCGTTIETSLKVLLILKNLKYSGQMVNPFERGSETGSQKSCVSKPI